MFFCFILFCFVIKIGWFPNLSGFFFAVPIFNMLHAGSAPASPVYKASILTIGRMEQIKLDFNNFYINCLFCCNQLYNTRCRIRTDTKKLIIFLYRQLFLLKTKKGCRRSFTQWCLKPSPFTN
jgi:hypothetical protein